MSILSAAFSIAATMLSADRAAAQVGRPCVDPVSEAPGRALDRTPAPIASSGGGSFEWRPRLFADSTGEPAPKSVASSGPRRFGAAAGELALLEVLPWAFDRYVARYDFAFISTRTIKSNFEAGWHYDRDHFVVNQSSHPFHGSLYFNAARSNGYGFWESGAFAMTGSLLWECCMENTAPSVNDFVNTTLGGMTRGEIAHRLSTMLLDNTASGPGRALREVGAAILNPVGSFNRLLRGEIGREFSNPDDRFPSVVALAADVGYRHIGGGAAHPDQAIASLSLL